MALNIALGCAAALLLLLATPLHVHLVLERDEALRTRVRLAWLFGLVRWRVRSGGSDRKAREEEERPTRRRRKRGRRIARRVAGNLLSPEVRARSLAFLRAVVRALRPRDLRLNARIGMSDPADTGLLWAVLGPLGVLLPGRDVRLEPDFDEACLRFQAAARIRLIPAQLLLLTTLFLVSPPVLRALLAR